MTIHIKQIIATLPSATAINHKHYPKALSGYSTISLFKPEIKSLVIRLVKHGNAKYYVRSYPIFYIWSIDRFCFTYDEFNLSKKITDSILDQASELLLGSH